MPNWCHSTLWVRGSAESVASFVAKVRTDSQPLTFAAHVPDWPKEVQHEIDEANKTTCRFCAGTGFRPRTREEAEKIGVSPDNYYEGAVRDVPDDERYGCNGCSDGEMKIGVPGTGRALPFMTEAAWYVMRNSQWGTKWDASFGEPIIAIGQEGMDVDACIEAEGVTVTPEAAIYKFDTAWSPPIPWLQRTSELEPELEFELQYGEPGNDFAGRVRYVAGLCIEDVELDVSDVLAPEELWF